MNQSQRQLESWRFFQIVKSKNLKNPKMKNFWRNSPNCKSLKYEPLIAAMLVKVCVNVSHMPQCLNNLNSFGAFVSVFFGELRQLNFHLSVDDSERSIISIDRYLPNEISSKCFSAGSDLSAWIVMVEWHSTNLIGTHSIPTPAQSICMQKLPIFFFMNNLFQGL